MKSLIIILCFLAFVAKAQVPDTCKGYNNEWAKMSDVFKEVASTN